MSRRSKHKNLPMAASKAAPKATRKASRKATRKAMRKAASTATSTVASKTASRAACHFLRIPIEIRLKIYGYLLLDPPRASLKPNQYEHTWQHHFGPEDEDMDSGSMGYGSFHTDVYGDSDSEDAMFDLDDFNPYGIPMGDMCDGMFNDVYNLGGAMSMTFGNDMFDYGDDHSDDRGFDRMDDEDESENESGPSRGMFETEPMIKRHLAILRTNRQIYNEASVLLHSDLTLDVNPGDAVTDVPGNAVVKQTKKIWRHSPHMGLGMTDSNGQTVYKSCPLDGSVEPHVFARFERISYNAQFFFEGDDAAPCLFINDDLSVRADDAAKYVSYLTTAKGITRWFEDPMSGRPFYNGRRETLKDVADITISSVTVTQPSTAEIIQKFVDLVSKSPLIRHLEVNLDLEVRCENWIESLKWGPDTEQTAKNDEKRDAANERAAELFIESGVLDSLRKLSNVKCFSLKVATVWIGETVMLQQQKHLNIIRDLKDVIEKNWAVKHGPR